MQWLTSLGPVGKVLYTIILIIEVLLVFNLMILVHEWGHFLAARWRGLKVEAFYIWFGKPLWKKKINGVEYGLGCIPAGGFVKLPQMAPMDAIEGASSSEEPLPPIKPLDKIIVAFAGPLFSFLLAVLFAFLVMVFGKPDGEHVTTTTIGQVDKNSLAAQAGLRQGDVIKTVDGKPIKRFEGAVDSVRWGIIASEGDEIVFEVERPGQPGLLTVRVPAKKNEEPEKRAWWEYIFKRPALRDIGIAGRHTPTVGETMPNSPAHDAKIQPDDQLLAVDGKPLLSPEQLIEYISEGGGKPVELTIKRASMEPFELNLTPRAPDVLPDNATADDRKPKIGIMFNSRGTRVLSYPSVLSQVSDASRSMFNMISSLIAARSDISPAHMSGPVGIGRVYYNILQDPNGLQLVLWFSVVLNINLAIMNMLPFPVLDGGHITLAIMEAIRGRSVHSRFLEIVQTVCALGIFGFMIFVTLKDVGDNFGGKKAGAPKSGWLPKDQRPTPAPATAP